MPYSSDFPHLHLSFKGRYDPRYPSGSKEHPEMLAARANPKAHADMLLQSLDDLEREDGEIRQQREKAGKPAIPADKGVLLRLPDGVDVESIAHALGVELVAETEGGLMLVSSQDISFQKLRSVLSEFAALKGGLVAGSSLQEIIYRPDDQRRLDAILGTEVDAIWPLEDAVVYIFDLGIQTATSTRTIQWPVVKQRKAVGETEEEFQKRRETARQEAWVSACMEWDEKAEERVDELRQFIQHYEGEIIVGMTSDEPTQKEHGMVFPDSVQVRVKMSGLGFKDVIQNFAHLFDVELPPELQQMVTLEESVNPDTRIQVLNPSGDAPTVCVIDSGIEEAHRLLAPAIDSASSRCFLPGVNPQDVADYFSPKGHGTRVAGAVLYPHVIPSSGEIEPVAWIQNARVLNEENVLPDDLVPEQYLQQVVAHFHAKPKFTKIFNHSINANVPCPLRRMTSWAAKLDQLSHEHDILFIQSAGNQTRSNMGDLPNPGLRAHLQNGLTPPEHQFEKSMRVANPAQSLHSLTVGSISAAAFEDADSRSFADGEHHPSGFSRTGYGQPWSVVKPDVVEIGGDLVYSKTSPHLVRTHADVSLELVNSTYHGAPAVSKDGIGTSFAAPKVAHIAAHLQSLFPDASPLLYRALIVQSARWPAWAEQESDKDKVLRLIGYGLPSVERATSNSTSRVTLVTPDAVILPSKQLHLYSITIPDELRNAALEARLRIDVTLAYTALPRRTRASRTKYLETWLDWRTSDLGEKADEFLERMTQRSSDGSNFKWTLHTQKNWGEASETNRQNGSVQKDWAIFEPHELPQEFSIAVRSHHGWNHRDGAASARYCLAVSFEVLEGDVPIYTWIENAVRVDVETEIEMEELE